MSWIRHPVYIITTIGNYIICYDCGWKHNLDVKSTTKQQARIVLDHLKTHLKHYLKSGSYDNYYVLEKKMLMIYLYHIPNKEFREEFSKHISKFNVNYLE